MNQVTYARIACIFALGILTASCAHDESTLPNIQPTTAALTTEAAAAASGRADPGCGTGFEGSGYDKPYVRGEGAVSGARVPAADKAELVGKGKPRKRPELPKKPAWLDAFDAEYKKQSIVLAAKHGTDRAGFEKERALLKRELLVTYRR